MCLTIWALGSEWWALIFTRFVHTVTGLVFNPLAPASEHPLDARLLAGAGPHGAQDAGHPVKASPKLVAGLDHGGFMLGKKYPSEGLTMVVPAKLQPQE